MAVSPWVVLLSGASSSGKTTLGTALLQLVSAPTVMLEANTAFPAVNAWPTEAGWPAPIVVFHRSSMAWFTAGTNVILDGSLPYEDVEQRRQCLQELPADHTFIIAVECSTEELRHREVTRPDERPSGWAELQAGDINHGLDPVITVDTSVGAVEDHAHWVLATLGEMTAA